MGKKRHKRGYCGKRARLKALKQQQSSLSDGPIDQVQHKGLEKLQAQLCRDGITVRPTDPSLRKLSEVLLEFVSDTIDLDAPLEEMRKHLLFAVGVWNQAVLDVNPRGTDRHELALTALALVQRGIDPMLFDKLLAKKQRDYPADKRLIQRIDVEEEQGHLTVNVASSDYGAQKRKTQ